MSAVAGSPVFSALMLYVNGAQQPCLVVNDLKQGEGSGAIALWIGSGTEAYFSGVTITRSP